MVNTIITFFSGLTLCGRGGGPNALNTTKIVKFFRLESLLKFLWLIKERKFYKISGVKCSWTPSPSTNMATLMTFLAGIYFPDKSNFSILCFMYMCKAETNDLILLLKTFTP